MFYDRCCNSINLQTAKYQAKRIYREANRPTAASTFLEELGDFNLNMQEAMFTSDRIVNDFYNMFLSYYLYPLINKPTRVHGNRSSTIDNIYTNISNVPVSGLFKTNFSDHYCIFCITYFNSLAVRAKEITKREFSNTNIQEFNKALSSHNWEVLYDADNFEQSFSYFYKKKC